MRLDVLKSAIAQAAPGRDPTRLMDEFAYDFSGRVRKLQSPSGAAGVPIGYEDRLTGYGLQRKWRVLRYAYKIIGPSLIRRRAEKRTETDRRDWLRLSELSLVACRQPSCRLSCAGKTAWAKCFGDCWLATVSVIEAPSSLIDFREYWPAARAYHSQVQRLTMLLLQATEGKRLDDVRRGQGTLRAALHGCGHRNRPGCRWRLYRAPRPPAQAHGLSRPRALLERSAAASAEADAAMPIARRHRPVTARAVLLDEPKGQLLGQCAHGKPVGGAQGRQVARPAIQGAPRRRGRYLRLTDVLQPTATSFVVGRSQSDAIRTGLAHRPKRAGCVTVSGMGSGNRG